MQNLENIIITTTDQQRLLPVLDQYDSSAAEALRDELYRAVILDPHAVPADVVTMNSEVVYEDGHGVSRRVKLVYPQDADASRGHVSVLAPIGTALLGLRVGQTIEWVVPNGTRKIHVVEIPYQPEAAGAFNL